MTRRWWRMALAAGISIFYMLPIYLTINIALRPRDDTRSLWAPARSIDFGNFELAIKQGRIGISLINSIVVSTAVIILVAVVGALAAYPLARRRTRTNSSIKALVLGVMMVPPLSILVALYSTMVQLHGISTYWGIVLIIVTFELPLSIYLYTNFIGTIPLALDEAAAIDGAGPFRTFFSVILPQLRPVTASVVILTGMHAWNDFQFSLYILQKPDMRTLPLAVASFFSQTESDLSAATAAAVIAMVPAIALFLALQRYFIQGMVDSAVK